MRTPVQMAGERVVLRSRMPSGNGFGGKQEISSTKCQENRRKYANIFQFWQFTYAE